MLVVYTYTNRVRDAATFWKRWDSLSLYFTFFSLSWFGGRILVFFTVEEHQLLDMFIPLPPLIANGSHFLLCAAQKAVSCSITGRRKDKSLDGKMEKQEKSQDQSFFFFLSGNRGRSLLLYSIRRLLRSIPSRFLYSHVIYISHCCLCGSHKRSHAPTGSHSAYSHYCRRVFACATTTDVPRLWNPRKRKKKKRRSPCNAQRTYTHTRHPSAKWTVKRLPLHTHIQPGITIKSLETRESRLVQRQIYRSIQTAFHHRRVSTCRWWWSIRLLRIYTYLQERVRFFEVNAITNTKRVMTDEYWEKLWNESVLMMITHFWQGLLNTHQFTANYRHQCI